MLFKPVYIERHRHTKDRNLISICKCLSSKDSQRQQQELVFGLDYLDLNNVPKAAEKNLELSLYLSKPCTQVIREFLLFKSLYVLKVFF